MNISLNAESHSFDGTEPPSPPKVLDVLPVDNNINIVFENEEPCPLTNEGSKSNYFTNTGGEWTIEEYGVEVTVPKEAIEDHHTVEIQVNSSLFGPFAIPDDYHPISTYVWIGANYTFKKPIKLQFEHYADISNSKNKSQLCILKACCTKCRTKCNNNQLVMHEITQEYVISDSVCTLYTDHFCSQCLATKNEQTPKRIVVHHYVPEDYKSVNDFSAEVCFSYDLTICIEVISHFQE